MSDNAPDLAGKTAGELSHLFRTGEASPEEATRGALRRIERYNEAVNAYVYVDWQGALDAARESTERWSAGRQLSELDGVPVSMKDLTEVRGMPAREGSLTSSEEPCQEDAPPARRMREAGAVILGKTNTPEFGFKAVTDNRVFGATANPWNTGLTPGGSSGGAAVAAALDMGVLHQGGDSGGSIRIPAAFTGTFGFKPTFGWTPQWPPAQAASLSHIGPITRTVEDAARMLNHIGRYDSHDPYAVEGQPDDWGAELDRPLDGLRVAYSPDLGFAEVDPEVAELVRAAVRQMEALGAHVTEATPRIQSPLQTYQTIWHTASRDAWALCDESERELLDPGLVKEAHRASELSALDYFRAESARAELSRELEQMVREHDLLLTPSVAIQPFAIGHETPPGSGLEDWESWASFSYPFNLGQQPAASVPCGFTRAGLPVGLQIVGAKFGDTAVLRAAHQYLTAHPPRFPERPDAVA
jgi:aspartyl-tRNA(Asn)/glutamyl-tRNA(Gln) amidotransferase subunit A